MTELRRSHSTFVVSTSSSSFLLNHFLDFFPIISTQPGNPQPRYFRLMADEGAINRFGFNSDGHAEVLSRLRERIRKWVFGVGSHNLPPPPSSLSRTASSEDVGLGLTLSEKDELNPSNLLASHMSSSSISSISDSLDLPRSLRPGHSFFVNLGKNKSSAENDNSDYIKGVETFGPYSDALVINVSSPNTPGLRSLQGKTLLFKLLNDVNKARNQLPKIQGLNGNYKEGKVPIILKVSSDLHELALKDVANVARANSVDAIIISNTTISRPENLISDPVITNEVGGLSGKPLKPLALNALRILHSELNDGGKNKAENKISLIGCGGIGSGKDALDFAKAGADVVELYTAFGYKGIGLPRRIKDELTILLKEEGKSWKDLVGTESKKQIGKDSLEENDMIEKANLTGQDTYRRTVAGIKAEIEALRASLNGTDTSASFKRAIPQKHQDKSESSRSSSSSTSTSSIAEAPRNPNQPSNPKTSLPIFKPDPSDKEYTSLLEKVNKALGINLVSEEESLNEEKESLLKLISEEQKKKEMERNLTLGEKLKSSLDWALLDPDFNDEHDKKKKMVSKVLAGKESGLKEGEDLDLDKLGKVMASRGGGSASLEKKEREGAGTKDGQWRVGMGGPRPDLKMVDKFRVV